MNLKTKQKGFTLVELLIVIVVIAILAAISIVAYNGIQNRAVETVIRSDLANFTKKMELFRVDSQAGTYPTTEADLGTASISISKSSYNTGGTGNNFLYCPLSSGAGWALVLVDKAGRAWTTTNQSGYSRTLGRDLPLRVLAAKQSSALLLAVVKQIVTYGVILDQTGELGRTKTITSSM